MKVSVIKEQHSGVTEVGQSPQEEAVPAEKGTEVIHLENRTVLILKEEKNEKA